MKNLLMLLMITLINACASTSKPNIRESLSTEIKPDGSKVFEFSVFMINVNNGNKAKNQQNTSQSRGRSRSTRGSNESSAEFTQYFDERLNSLPIITLFCRKDYFVLDRLNAKDEITIRAECHDSATSEDYLRFKSSELPIASRQ